MRVCIIGGLERLSGEYVSICKGLGCRAKVYNKLGSNFEGSLKCAQCVLLFTTLSSHKMASSAKKICRNNNIPFICIDSASPGSVCCALKDFMNCSSCSCLKKCRGGGNG